MTRSHMVYLAFLGFFVLDLFGGVPGQGNLSPEDYWHSVTYAAVLLAVLFFPLTKAVEHFVGGPLEELNLSDRPIRPGTIGIRVLGFGLLCWALIQLANLATLRSWTAVYLVTGKHMTGSSSKASAILELQAVSGMQMTEELRVSDSVYANAEPRRTTVTIKTSRGLLGMMHFKPTAWGQVQPDAMQP